MVRNLLRLGLLAVVCLVSCGCGRIQPVVVEPSGPLPDPIDEPRLTEEGP